ncbi:MAG: ABC transporter permease [Muribaculaceae bacterium]|nr:ABC transporter permease [Muribaculaceae bacterium]
MKTALFDIENWREIGATLSRNKTRTLLTAFGIFWGTAMLAMLLGGEKGLERKLMKNFEGFATNSAVFFANRRTVSYQGFNKGSGWSITFKDIDAIRQLDGVDAVATTNSVGSVTVSAGKHGTSAQVQGADHEYVRVFLPKMFSGRFINESDQVNARKVAVVGKNIADKVFPGRDPVGEFINIAGIYYKVIGVAGQEAEINVGGEKLDDQINIPISTLSRAFNLGDVVGGTMMTAKDGYTPTQLKPRIFRVLRANHPIAPHDDQALFFFDISEQFAMVDKLFSGVNLLALFVGIGTLIAGIIGVGNIMWVIVKERTQEIGIRRAIGAKPLDIVTQILSEGIALTFIAGMAGIIFAVCALAVVQQIAEVSFLIGFGQAISIMAIFMILGMGASIIPSLKAMKIKPIEAINDK